MADQFYANPINDISPYSISGTSQIDVKNYYFIMVINGTLEINLDYEKNLLRENDIIVLSPDNQYTFSSIDTNLFMVVNISQGFITELIGPHQTINCNSSRQPDIDFSEIRRLLTEMTSVYFNDFENNRLHIYGLLYQLLQQIKEHHLISTIGLSNLDASSKHATRIQEIIDYVNDNYQNAITLHSLADSLFLTPQYLSKFIKKHFNMTFYDYMNLIRLRHAVIELQNTEAPITKVAYNNGFPNLTAFNKTFRQAFQMTPSEYRKSLLQNKQPQTVPSSSRGLHKEDYKDARNYLIRRKNTLRVRSEQEVSPNHYIVQTKAVDTHLMAEAKNDYYNMLNAGFAKALLSGDYQIQVKEAAIHLKLKYVRFQGLFSDQIMPRSGSGFDLLYANAILDFLDQLGLIPFIEVSNKPQKTTINTSSSGLLLSNSTQYTPQVDKDEHKLASFIRHCVNRYGIHKVSRWRFEVWAQHDNLLKYKEPPDEYALRFTRVKKTIQDISPDTQVGGPGFNTCASHTDYEQYLKALCVRQTPPDFITFYFYPYTYNRNEIKPDVLDTATYAILSPDEDIFLKRILLFRKATENHLSILPPIYITEFNSEISSNNCINNTCFQSAFICKNMIQLYEHIEGMFYWFLSDMAEDYVDLPEMMQCGIGLIDTRGIPKPSFFACQLMCRLGNQLISLGPNYIITKNDTYSYQILAYNYAHLNRYYCLNYVNYMNIENTYDFFESKDTMTYEFRLTDLPEGRYKIKRHILNRSYGSILDLILQMHTKSSLTYDEYMYIINNFSYEELQYFKSSCIPRQMIQYKDILDTLTIICRLEAHEVSLFEITREF